MTNNVIVQIPVDVMTWYQADKVARMGKTTLACKLREYMHYLAKEAERDDGATDDTADEESGDVSAPSASMTFKKSGLRCYDRYAHRVIDTAEIRAGGTPAVVEALPLEDRWIEVRFDDGRHGVFDMNLYLDKPAFRQLKDDVFFKRLYVKDGVVCWSDDIDIAAERMWTDCESVTEHWTYPEDWPKIGDIGPDGSPIVFVTDEGFPVTDKLEDQWAEEFDREDFRWEPEAPIFRKKPSQNDESERSAQQDKRENED